MDARHDLYYGADNSVYMRLNLGTEMPGSTALGLEGRARGGGRPLTFTPQDGKDHYPSYYLGSYPSSVRRNRSSGTRGRSNPGEKQNPGTMMRIRRCRRKKKSPLSNVTSGHRTSSSATTRLWRVTWPMRRISAARR